LRCRRALPRKPILVHERRAIGTRTIMQRPGTPGCSLGGRT
jgi:hypothetical protein